MSSPDSKTTVAAFDFDGTLTTRDSLWDFLIFSFGYVRLFTHLVWTGPTLFLHVLGKRTNAQAKEKLLGSFLKGMPVSRFSEITGTYATKRLPLILRPEALDKLRGHTKQGHEVMIISASVENWIQPWATAIGIKTVAATQVETKDGALTGLLKGENCYGQEKVTRLLKAYPNRKDYTLIAYGDGTSDRELLAFADYPHYRTF